MGKLSGYVTTHPGQLSLAILLWEGNRRSGVALAMTIVLYPPTGSTAYERWAPRLHSFGVWPFFTLPFSLPSHSWRDVVFDCICL